MLLVPATHSSPTNLSEPSPDIDSEHINLQVSRVEGGADGAFHRPALIVTQDVGNGWVRYSRPHRGRKYFHNSSLNLVTTKDIRDPAARARFLQEYRPIADENPSFEYLVDDGHVLVVDHVLKTAGLYGGPKNVDRKGHYWVYFHNFPCHRELPGGAETEALGILQLMVAQNLTNISGIAVTPFSMEDIQRFIDFINLSKTLDTGNEKPINVARSIIITNIIANFYTYQLDDRLIVARPITRTLTAHLWKRALTVACWGMPPNYLRRFTAAHDIYRRTRQRAAWHLFLDQVRKERAAANVVAGLLLASSVAFLAIPNLVDVAQFFIILSIGLALGSVVMGFNGHVDEKLSELQYIPDHSQSVELTAMALAMEQHYTTLLLSILCFFLSLFAFTAYSIYSTVFGAMQLTVRYLFFSLAASGLIIMMGTILRWNRQFLRRHSANSHLHV